MDASIEKLAHDTENWTSGIVIRYYTDSEAGRKLAALESQQLLAHNYAPHGESVYNDGDRHLNVRRTAANVLLTGGIGLVLFGASRSGGKTVVEAHWWLEGHPFQPREVNTYPHTSNRGLRIRDLVVIHDEGLRASIFGGHLEVQAALANDGTEDFEAVEVEISLYRVPDLTRVEVGRVVLTDVRPGTSIPFAYTVSPQGMRLTPVLVPRRVLPLNGIWTEPDTRRTLFATLLPNSPYVSH